MNGQRSRHLLRVAGLTLAACASVGCYRAHVSSGLPPGDPAGAWDFRWKHAFLFGQADTDENTDLSRVCPSGWAEIDERHDLLTAATTVGTLGMYTPRRVTVVCAGPTRSLRPAQRGYDPPLVEDLGYPSASPGDPPPPPPPRLP